MAGLIPITASVASSFAEGFTGLSGTSLTFNNSGAGITFGSQSIGPASLTSSPGQNQQPSLENPSTAALGNAASGTGTPIPASGGTSSLTLILVLAAGAVAVYLLLKKK